MPMPVKRSEKIAARVKPSARDLVATAADLAGETVSELVRRAALREAKRIVDRRHMDPRSMLKVLPPWERNDGLRWDSKKEELVPVDEEEGEGG